MTTTRQRASTGQGDDQEIEGRCSKRIVRLGLSRAVGFVAPADRPAYQTARKPLPFSSGIWLPDDYESTVKSRLLLHD